MESIERTRKGESYLDFISRTKVPAEVAGIKLPYKNWVDLIRQAGGII